MNIKTNSPIITIIIIIITIIIIIINYNNNSFNSNFYHQGKFFSHTDQMTAKTFKTLQFT